MGLVALLPGRSGPLGAGGGGATLAWQGGYRADVPLAALQHPAGWGERGGGARRGSPSPPVGPLARFPGGCRGIARGYLPRPPLRLAVRAARPPLQRALPGLFCSPGRRARPGGLAAGGSVPAVTPAHLPRWRPGGGGGLGRSVSRPPSGAWLGGPRGAGGGESLCLGSSLCLPCAGTKAGFIGVVQPMEGVASILLRFVSAHCRPDAVCGVPLRAGAGLQACRGHCGSGWVAVWGRVAHGPSGAPPRAPRSSRKGGVVLGWPGEGGGGQGRGFLCRPPAFRGLGGGRGGGRASSGLPVVIPRSPDAFRRQLRGGWLEGLSPGCPYDRRRRAARPSMLRSCPGLAGVLGRRARPGGLAAGGSVPAGTPAHTRGGGGRGREGWAPVLGAGARRGGIPGRWSAHPSRPPSGRWAPGCRLDLRPQSPSPPRRHRLIAWHWWGVEGGRLAPGAAVRVSGQRSVICRSAGLLCRARPRAPRRWRTPTACAPVSSAVPSTGGDTCPPAARTAGGVGGGARVCCLGSGARLAACRAIAAGRGCYLRLRLRGGWGCGGGGFLGR